jgi:hypothetical protein
MTYARFPLLAKAREASLPSPSLSQAGFAAANEERAYRHHESWNGHQKVCQRHSKSIDEAESCDA